MPVYDFEAFDFYELLGVSPSASPEEIKRAYRREIARYHPDRYVNADPKDLEYARRRSQLLTEAYATLSNPAARSAYNLGRRRSGAKPLRPAPPPPTQRDYQTELYQQAQEHLKAGRYVQAIAALRQLHQINPFYRDSAELLAEAEARLRSRVAEKRSTMPLDARRRLTLAAGAAAVIVLVGGVVWWLGWRNELRSVDAGQGAVIATPGSVPSPAPDTPTPIPPTPVASPEPTRTPLPSPLPQITIEPSTPTMLALSDTPKPTPLPPSPTIEGVLLLRDTTFDNGWASARRSTWSVGPRDGQYRITAEAQVGVIWSYRSIPASDISLAVDVEVVQGEGGALLRFRDEQNYLIFTLAPRTGAFSLEQVRNGEPATIASGARDALRFPEGRFKLEILLRGNRVNVTVNNQVVTEADVSHLPTTPRFGLAVVARDTRSEVLFDNLEIRAAP